MTDKQKTLEHYQELEELAKIRAASRKQESSFICECRIRELGLPWTASIEYSATAYDGTWELDGEYKVEISPDEGKNWFDVYYGDLSPDSQLDIEAVCLKDLDSLGAPNYDA